jgi:PiT family inorganic phosphate transporter
MPQVVRPRPRKNASAIEDEDEWDDEGQWNVGARLIPEVARMERFLTDIIDIARQPYVLLIVLTALAFDFINGFHDAANSIATIVGTRVLRPMAAVIWAAWWNFVAAWFFGVLVANTVAKMVHTEFVNPDVIFGGLIGAIVWNLFTWFFGLPTSSSHALLGGFGGAAMAYAGQMTDVLHHDRFIRTVQFIVISPLVGMVLALLLVTALLWLLRNAVPAKVERYFRVVQLGSAAAFSLGHGTNDAQKTMGIIAALLYSHPDLWRNQQAAFEKGDVDFPFWIVLACHLALGVGTLAGGWRIVKTMGLRIAKLKPYSGACAETAAAVALFATAELGIPVSTTHTITGAIVGVGAVQRFSAVRWGVARRVVWAWVMTIPMSAIVAAISYWIIAAVQSAF